MNIIWAPEAIQDRRDIWDYISADNVSAAIKMDALFGASVARLRLHPLLGKDGIIMGTRELILHESYRLVYEVGQEYLVILALVHTARQWPLVR